LAHVSWAADGRFSVTEVQTGRKLSAFRESGTPVLVLVDETHWRLMADIGKKSQIGRYRRDVVSVWDLATGARLEELADDDFQRRHAGYLARSATTGFGTDLVSPNRRLRAVATTHADGTAVAVRDAETGEEIFRADRPDSESVRVGFDAEGRCLVAYWRSGTTGRIEVWEI
jgi:hypothetical protein